MEAGEGVGIEDLGPFVGVVSRGVGDGAGEEVAEAAGHGGGAEREFGGVAVEDFAINFVEVAVVVFGGVDVEFEVEFAEGELAHVGGGGHVVASGDHLVEEFVRDVFTGFVVVGEEVE